MTPELSRRVARALALVVDPAVLDAAAAARTDAELEAVLALTAAAWDESRVTRVPSGTANRQRDEREGGQFAPKGAAGGDSPPRYEIEDRAKALKNRIGRVLRPQARYNQRNRQVGTRVRGLKQDTGGYEYVRESAEGTDVFVDVKYVKPSYEQSSTDPLGPRGDPRPIRHMERVLSEAGLRTEAFFPEKPEEGTYRRADLEPYLRVYDSGDPPTSVTAAAWDETRVRRVPSGTANRQRDEREGGQFAPKTVTNFSHTAENPAPPGTPLGQLHPGDWFYMPQPDGPARLARVDTTGALWVGIVYDDDRTTSFALATEETAYVGARPPGVPPADAIEVTGRSLKDGSTVWMKDRYGTWREMTVVDATGRWKMLQWTAEDGSIKRSHLRSSSKVWVSPADYPAAAKRAATVAANHVTGEGAKVFRTTPGPRARATKVAQTASDELGRIGVSLPDNLPDDLKVPLSETRSELNGGYYQSTVRDGRSVPVSLKVRGFDSTPEEMLDTMHHELGHYLDSALLSEGRDYGSTVKNPAVLMPVMDAIDRTEAMRRVREMASDSPVHGKYRVSAGGRDLPIDVGHARYLGSSAERWARAWEQYVATKVVKAGADPVRMDRYRAQAAPPLDVTRYVLEDGMNLQGFYGSYWTEEDFAPVEREIDAMLGRVGWSQN